jgi:hypothetical protein
MSYLMSLGVSKQYRARNSQCLVVNTDRQIAVINQLMYRKKGVVWLVQISGKSAKNEGQSYFNNSLGDLQLNISHRSHLEAVSH